MTIRVPKNIFHQFLFVLCVAIPTLNIYELTFAIWSITILITLQNKYSNTIFIHVLVYLAILFVAFTSSYRAKFQLYYYIKDITYLLKPAMGLLIGYQLFRKNNIKPFQIIIYTGLILASIHVILVAITFLSGHAKTLAKLREYCGYFNDFEVYALIILLFHKKFQIKIENKRLYPYIIVMVLSAFFYFARTNFIQFIILYIALKGYFEINPKSITIISSVFLLTIVGYTIIYNLNPRRDGTGVEQFLYKIKNAPIEPFKTKIDLSNWKDLNDNYRSYENILTIRQVTGKGLPTIISGEGLGSSVDLKQKIWLQSSFMRYIPFLHNCYMTAYLKSGLIGVFLLLFYIYLLLTFKSSQIPLVHNLNLLFVGTGIFLIISNWVFLGLYNLLEAKSILIGFLIAHRESIIKNVNND